jgi:hypothetical protein
MDLRLTPDMYGLVMFVLLMITVVVIVALLS